MFSSKEFIKHSDQNDSDLSDKIKVVSNQLEDLRRNVSDTNSRFGGRIGKLEAREEVREEQYKHLKEKLEGLSLDIDVFQKENKLSITELRTEHKESMSEIKQNHKEILDTVLPLKHAIEDLQHIEDDVETLKGKSGKTWENVKEHILAYVVAIICAIIAAAVGLSNFAH